MTTSTPRRATGADLPSIVAGASAVFRPHGGPDAMAHDYPLLYAPANVANLWLAGEPGGVVRAHAGFTRRTVWFDGRRVEVACLGAVFTRPGEEGRGLGSAVVAAAVEAALAGGAQLVMVSGARGLYSRAGCVPYPTPWFEVPVPGDAVADGQAALVRAAAADAGALAALAEGERVRFVRSLDDWRALLEARTVFYGPGQTWVLRAKANAAAAGAYLAVQRLSSGRSRVVEYAGDRSLVVDAARRLAERGPLALLVPPYDNDMLLQAHASGLAPELVTLPFSVRVADPDCARLIPPYGLDYV